ncbi:MAG: hypothetical protein NTX73_06665 [Rhodobacterales bacterium]|nr:hypothetical protein [Rhodobacterales bacterium]
MVIEGQSHHAAPVVVVVGSIRGWARDKRRLPEIDGFHFVGFGDIDEPLFERLHPEIVLSALMGEGFDAMDLARRLNASGFRGRYRAVTTALPHPLAVIEEIRAAAPGIDFDLFIVSGPLSS